MPSISNKSRKPLSIPLPGGKKLHLGPGQSGQIAANASEHAPLKKLVESGDIEIIGDEASRSGGGRGSLPGRTFIGSNTPSSASRRSGDR